jgi:ADP-ribose pyrophosphatase
MSEEDKSPKILGEGRFLRLLAQDGWEWVERTQCSGVVVILALTPENKVLLVEQFRAPMGNQVIEFPAGLAGDLPGQQNEAMRDAAIRELLEETGYQAEEMHYHLAGPISAGMSSEQIHFLEARGLKKVGPGGGDETESITVHEIPLDQADAWLRKRILEGTLVDPKVFAGLYFLQREDSKVANDI